MKNIQLFIIFLITNMILAQNTRFIYDYESIPDTLNKDNVVDEIMILEINPKDGNSVFSSLKKIKSDSMMTSSSQKGFSAFPDKTMEIRYIVEKRDKKIFFYTANHTMFPVRKVEDKRLFKWHLTSDKKEILSYNAQKATTKFGGRVWTAWFTKELPFSDGPYKFNGLPGLILKISDESGSHIFELVGIEKTVSNSYHLLNDDNSYFSYKSSIPFTNEQYKKEYLENRNDPIRDLRQKVIAGQIFFNSIQEKNDYLKRTESNLKNEVARHNNPIEKDLLKP